MDVLRWGEGGNGLVVVVGVVQDVDTFGGVGGDCRDDGVGRDGLWEWQEGGKDNEEGSRWLVVVMVVGCGGSRLAEEGWWWMLSWLCLCFEFGDRGAGSRRDGG